MKESPYRIYGEAEKKSEFQKKRPHSVTYCNFTLGDDAGNN